MLKIKKVVEGILQNSKCKKATKETFQKEYNEYIEDSFFSIINGDCEDMDDVEQMVDELRCEMCVWLAENLYIKILPSTTLAKDDAYGREYACRLGKNLYIPLKSIYDYDEYTDEDFFDVDENGIVSINYDDAIPDAVSDETGWLVYDTDYIITLNPNA